MKEWQEIVSIWNKCKVPDLVWVPYSSKTNFRNGVWFDIKEQRQLCFDSRPIEDTAIDLINLRGGDRELIIAFKIKAFIQGMNSPTSVKLKEILTIVLNKNEKVRVGHWHHRAKGVLPIIFDDRDLGGLAPYRLEMLEDMNALVMQAAITWGCLAKTVAILEVPLLLTNGEGEPKSSTFNGNDPCPLLSP